MSVCLKKCEDRGSILIREKKNPLGYVICGLVLSSHPFLPQNNFLLMDLLLLTSSSPNPMYVISACTQPCFPLFFIPCMQCLVFLVQTGCITKRVPVQSLLMCNSSTSCWRSYRPTYLTGHETCVDGIFAYCHRARLIFKPNSCYHPNFSFQKEQLEFSWN